MKTASLTKSLLTAEDFCEFVQLPENESRWFELVRGEVIELPPPQRPHGVVCGKTAVVLGIYQKRRKWGEVVTNDSGVVLERDPDTVRAPDIAFFEGPQAEDEHGGYSLVPPLLAVEVLCPDDNASLWVRKNADLLANGVALAWVLDPATKTVVVFRKDQHPYVLFAQDEITGEDVLPGFRCKVADFFPRVKKTGTTKASKTKIGKGNVK